MIVPLPAAFSRELAATTLPAPPPDTPPVTAAELGLLPGVVRRYLDFMGVVGRSRDWSFRVAAKGQFRLHRDGAWMPCEAWQYNTRVDIARVFRMRIRMGGVLPLVGHDTYVDGHGRALVKFLDLFPVADEAGEEQAVGELVTWLNDAVLVAPSMLLGEGVQFSAVGRDAFDVSVTDAGRTVTARVFLAVDGAPIAFETSDRFLQDPDHPDRQWIRARWRTPVDDWTRVDGRRLPTRGRATWFLTGGPFTYLELSFRPETLRFNVPPGS